MAFSSHNYGLIMARLPNELQTRQLRVSTTPQVVKLLEALVETGLYGKNPAEAAERVLAEKLREQITTGQLAELRAVSEKPFRSSRAAQTTL
jgi:hypothetical protein